MNIKNIFSPQVSRVVPYTLRYGTAYPRVLRNISRVEQLPPNELRQFVFSQMKDMVSNSFDRVPFYRSFYMSKEFVPSQLKCFEDLLKIPVVSKNDLQVAPLSERSVKKRMACRKSNTGGTTGQPLSFYLPRKSDVVECAHIHTIWRQADYRPTDLKLSFRGENMGGRSWAYRIGQNELTLNTYLTVAEQCVVLAKIIKDFPAIRFLHGYPSLIARFCDAVNEYPELKRRLSRRLKGIFLGSEFAAPPYRAMMRRAFKVPIVSWYGHSERAVLAFERSEAFLYEPFLSYGYAEAVPDGFGRHKLMATSFSNPVCPFIRYDTGDYIEPVDVSDGILRAFRIKEGRDAEEVYDRKGHPISLTGLIFGRHHEIFNHAQHLQVEMLAPGRILLWITAPHSKDWKLLFDSTGLDMEVEYKTIPEPIRASSGKIPLLVQSSPKTGAQ